jgi:hypothetical protein
LSVRHRPADLGVPEVDLLLRERHGAHEGDIDVPLPGSAVVVALVAATEDPPVVRPTACTGLIPG